MVKHTLPTLFLGLCFGAFACTGKSSGRLAEEPGSGAKPPGLGDPSSLIDGGSGKPNELPRVANDPVIKNNPGDPDVVPVNPGDPGGPPPEPVPEPMTMLLFGSGLAGLAYRFRRRNEEEEVAEVEA